MKTAIIEMLAAKGVSVGPRVDLQRLRGLIERMYPVTTDAGLIRMGAESDGGYLLPDDLEGLVACFSPGVDVKASFEGAFVARKIPCFLADASVDGPPFVDPLIHFDKKFLGVVQDEATITMDHWVKTYAPPAGDLILQMDIEGAEWPVLLNLSDEVLKRFRIIVLELHYLGRLLDKEIFEFLYAALDRLLRSYHVVHLHPNNVARPLRLDGLTIPPVLEVTLLRRDRAQPTGFATQFPHPLDRKNLASRPDLILPPGWYQPTIGAIPSPGSASGKG